MTSPVLWYLNRGTGLVLLVLFTLTTFGGVLATSRATSRWWPRFVTQGLHRTLGLMSVTLLAMHVLTAVLDEYVDIRWWQALLPFGATYQPVFLSLGTLALDLTVAVVVTSLLRDRLSPGGWRAIHLSSYGAWLVAVVHGWGIGTDSALPLGRAVLIGCVGLVAVAVTTRVAILRREAVAV